MQTKVKYKKSKKCLIFNGDATYHQYKVTDTISAADLFVMRETYCMGPVQRQLNDTFWESRKIWFQKYYQCDSNQYNDKVLSQLKIDYSQYSEVVIWYEYDLYCQINTLFLINWIRSNYKVPISIICVGDDIVPNRWMGLGEIDPQLYPQLYHDRQLLSDATIELAQALWNAYTSPNVKHLYQLFQDKTTDGALPHLHRALKAHFKLFPDFNSGLNFIESIIAHRLYEKSHSKMELVRLLLNEDEVYGYGDLQYLIIIDHFLHALNIKTHDNDAAIHANSKLRNIILGKKKYEGGSPNDMVGGCLKNSYWWSDSSGLIEV